MMGQGNIAHIPAALLCGALAIALPVAAAVADEPVTPDMARAIAAEASPATLRGAMDLVAQHFDFTVIGANRLGLDAPSWPAEDRGAEAMLNALLKDYSYVVLLKPETNPDAAREPETVLIVGLNHPPPADAAKPAPAPGGAKVAAAAGAGIVADMAPPPVPGPPSWAPRPSTVVRALTKLAATNGMAPAGGQNPPSTPPLPNPAQNAAAMASLTQSAQAGLGALVIGLRQACPTPNSC